MVNADLPRYSSPQQGLEKDLHSARRRRGEFASLHSCVFFGQQPHVLLIPVPNFPQVRELVIGYGLGLVKQKVFLIDAEARHGISHCNSYTCTKDHESDYALISNRHG